jgi:outer membrane protein OmpA-like peptidoglycan-associated protein
LILAVTVMIQDPAIAQETDEQPIQLANPSFEDMPRHSKPPRGWYDCGFERESPPDVQPNSTFSVTKAAQDGETYLGMVVRDNDTWEAVSQRLSRPLQKGKCYSFSLHLARSELYLSTSRVTDQTANYTTPAKIRIYGGFNYCDKQFLLAESSLVINTRWLEYNFKFEPIDNYSFLILEVFYKTPTLFPYNGNVLVDNASDIRPIPCDQEPIVAEEMEEEEPEPASPPAVTEQGPPREEEEQPAVAQPQTPEPPPPSSETTPEPEEEAVSFSKLSRSDLREGQTIRIDKLFFEADRSVIRENSYSVLNEIYEFMKRNSDVVVEIGGHTNGLCTDVFCDKLSEQRARAVAVYLAQRGIDWERLKYKGYGKRQPIASNDTPEGRQRNQRVEVKILGFNG